MTFAKVEICGINTADLKVLTSKKMSELLKDVKNGDDSAREKLIKGNLRLVLSVVQKFSNRNESMDDLFQVGCVGLIKAIDNFDDSHNVKFSTYAVPMIIGEIRRYLRDNSSMRISRSLRDIAYQALQIKEKLTKKLSREPSIEEIAKEMKIDETEVCMSLAAIQDPVSLFDPIYHDGGDEIYVMDQVQDNKNSDENWIENISIKEGIGTLGKRERVIIDLRFFKGKTQMEVAKEIGISQAQVSRIEKNALKHIKKFV